jgi:hypothetical protein
LKTAKSTKYSKELSNRSKVGQRKKPYYVTKLENSQHEKVNKI